MAKPKLQRTECGHFSDAFTAAATIMWMFERSLALTGFVQYSHSSGNRSSTSTSPVLLLLEVDAALGESEGEVTPDDPPEDSGTNTPVPMRGTLWEVGPLV